MARQRESAKGSAESHRWAIDRMEEGTAAVEQDGDQVYEIPRWLIPATAREGDVLAATVEQRADGEVSVTVRLDRAATDAARAPKRPKGTRSPRDPGGDIAL